MRRRQKSLPFALGASIRNPFSREILRRCVLAQRPVSLDELAESMDGLRSDEAAQLLHVPRSTLYELLRSRHLPHVRMGRNLRFTRTDLAVWVQRNTFR